MRQRAGGRVNCPLQRTVMRGRFDRDCSWQPTLILDRASPGPLRYRPVRHSGRIPWASTRSTQRGRPAPFRMAGGLTDRAKPPSPAPSTIPLSHRTAESMPRSAAVRCNGFAGARRDSTLALSTFDLDPEVICLMHNDTAQLHLTQAAACGSARSTGSNVSCSDLLGILPHQSYDEAREGLLARVASSVSKTSSAI